MKIQIRDAEHGSRGKSCSGLRPVRLDTKLLAGETRKRSGVGNLLLPSPLCLGARTWMVKDPEMPLAPRDRLSAELFYGASVWVDVLQCFERNIAQRYH